jgi:predicted ATPase
MSFFLQVIFVRQLENRMHFSHLFNGNASSELQNIVMLEPLNGDVTQSWRNVGKEVEALLADEARAQYIVARSVEVFRDRFISPASVACYWRVSSQFIVAGFALSTDQSLPLLFA